MTVERPEAQVIEVPRNAQIVEQVVFKEVAIVAEGGRIDEQDMIVGKCEPAAEEEKQAILKLICLVLR